MRESERVESWNDKYVLNHNVILNFDVESDQTENTATPWPALPSLMLGPYSLYLNDFHQRLQMWRTWVQICLLLS